MARIPTQNRYPDRAGYTVLNTDTNQLEVFSDGTFKPIGEPFSIFSENIDITVGPGGDFTDVNEALAYIQYLQPKFRILTTVGPIPGFDQYNLDLQINLIFKEGYVFTHPIVFENIYAPWLNITQENLNVPLEINIPKNPNFYTPLITIGMFQSRLRNITLNVKNINLTDLLLTPLYMVNSTLNELRLEVQDVEIGVYMSHNSVIKEIKRFIANRIQTYAIYLCYDCYTMILAFASNAFNINDVGVTHPSSKGAAIWLTASRIYIYGPSSLNPYFINNVHYAFGPIKLSHIIFGSLTIFNIDNVSEAIFYTSEDGQGSVTINRPLGVGPNINAIFSRDITPNTYNKRLLVSTNCEVTIPIS